MSIDVEAAWRIVRAARRRQPGIDWRVNETITISPGGTWSAACEVDTAATALFDTLLPVAYNSANLVIAQIGQSLDGHIATINGHSHYITGKGSRVHLHRLRALVDAVVVGANTVIADDPQLTVRHVAGDDPARVVLDPSGRVPWQRGVFTDGGPSTWHVVQHAGAAAPGGAALCLPAGEAGEMPRRVLAALAERGLCRVLVEGGGETISRFIQAGCIDRLHVVVASMLIGSGRPALNLAAIATLDQAIRPACRSYPLGEDRLYDLDLRKRA
jgi:riboflavin-specific deaminase-like protein